MAILIDWLVPNWYLFSEAVNKSLQLELEHTEDFVYLWKLLEQLEWALNGKKHNFKAPWKCQTIKTTSYV